MSSLRPVQVTVLLGAALLVGLAAAAPNIQLQGSFANCKAPATAPQKLERVVEVCQNEIKFALLQEALNLLGLGIADEDSSEEEEPVKESKNRTVTIAPAKSRPKRDSSFSQEERRVAGCLLQCVYRKVKAVDDTGFPQAEGMVRLYSEGVQDNNYYSATVQAVERCVSFAQALKLKQPNQKFASGQTCDLAYDMFECISEKIERACGGAAP
ncbi:unnamed protein product [Bemisia tabaci]|uniref:Uncharacterized protein n=1 Tax=Bemisia tabaci TaxID=7038 RepID=A0A9P0CCI1_BEMTA|nr:unnamed protein product [Bemisia tabaci]